MNGYFKNKSLLLVGLWLQKKFTAGLMDIRLYKETCCLTKLRTQHSCQSESLSLSGNEISLTMNPLGMSPHRSCSQVIQATPLPFLPSCKHSSTQIQRWDSLKIKKIHQKSWSLYDSISDFKSFISIYEKVFKIIVFLIFVSIQTHRRSICISPLLLILAWFFGTNVHSVYLVHFRDWLKHA